jgi:hypothetical protein
MGLVDWLRNNLTADSPGPVVPDTSLSTQRPEWMRDGMHATEVSGHDDLRAVGESFHQDILWLIVGGRTRDPVRHDIHALLVAEHGNAHDENAVSVWIAGHRVGHLSRTDARLLRAGLIRLQRQYRQPIALPGHVIGGGADGHRLRSLGVFLNFDAAAFGVPARGVRTRAVETDESDDRYDLGWLGGLPVEPEPRVRRLRQLVGTETDRISRHYVFAELESTLYRLRDKLPSALGDYDDVCRSHDAEMDRIVPALVDKFGAVPLLETYRQAAIRHHKANNPGMALWWSERGLMRYADHPVDEDVVRDLHKRAGTYRSAVRR